jgi:cyanophycinase
VALFLKFLLTMELPKGYLIAIGGAEDKGEKEGQFNLYHESAILRNVVDIIQQHNEPCTIGVVTTASSIPDEVSVLYDNAFKKLGVTTVEHFDIIHREEADDKAVLDKLAQCSGIFFTGGDQLQLTSRLGGTDFLNTVRERYFNEPFVVAGTSAGAMALSNIMISGGSATKAHLKGRVKISIGFNFLDNIIIDTHFNARGRFNRLAQVVATQPNMLGIGLEDDTGIIIRQGSASQIIGYGTVTIMDGKHITDSNISIINNDYPISLKNLLVHLLCNNDTYNISTRTF